MLTNLTNFKSLFNNLNGLENFETENKQLNTYNPTAPTEQKLFTPILMPYDFESNDPIGDLFKKVNLDGNVISPKSESPKKRSNIIDSEASLITECPPGSKPVGEINVNSTYLNCKPDGLKMPIQSDRKFLSEKNSCVFKSKFSSANSTIASTLMPKSNNNIKSETDDKDMITRSANGSKVLTNVVPMNKSDISETKSQKSISISANVKSNTKDKKMISRSAKSKNALTTIMSDSGLSSSSLFSSEGSSSDGSILSSTSSKKSKSSDNSYKDAVKRAARETFTVTEN
jgi:hypothetical protein